MMKLDKFRNYNNLPADQEDELYKIFIEYINKNNLSIDAIFEHFNVSSDQFANFLLILETKTKWFDYKQMDSILDEIDLYLEQIKNMNDASNYDSYD